jgi:hypothetical protein
VPGPSSAPLLPSIPVVVAPEPGPASPLPLEDATLPSQTPAARRRRTVLAVLTAATLLALAGAVAGLVPPAFAAVCVVLLGLDVAALRRVAVAERRRRAELAAAARRRTARAARTAVRPEPAPVAVPVQPTPAEAPDADEPAVPVVEQPAAVVADGTWVPVPVPPPTYTLKPMAPRAEPAPLEPALDPASVVPVQPAPVAEPAAAVAVDLDVDLDSVLERRRAVNG